MILVLVPILVFIPAVFWFFIFLKEDRFDPEPKKLIIKIFLLGALAGIGATLIEIGISTAIPGFFEQTITDFLNKGFIGQNLNLLPFTILILILLAAIEEVLKIGVVKELSFNEPHFNQIVDGAIFGISSALGFAAFENLGYFFQTSLVAGLGGLIMVFILRGLATTLMHALTTGLAGYYVGKIKFGGKGNLYWKGLAAAIAIHAAFNLLITIGIFGLIISIILLIGLFIFLIRKMESLEAQIIWRLVFLQNIKAPQA